MSEHTALPWTVGPSGTAIVTKAPDDLAERLRSGESVTVRRICVCDHGAYVSKGEAKANTKYIERAANSHASLLAACEAALEDHVEFCNAVGSKKFDSELIELMKRWKGNRSEPLLRSAISQAKGQ